MEHHILWYVKSTMSLDYNSKNVLSAKIMLIILRVTFFFSFFQVLLGACFLGKLKLPIALPSSGCAWVSAWVSFWLS